MTKQLSDFERQLLEEFCFHRPEERALIPALEVESRQSEPDGFWCTFATLSAGQEYCLSLDSEIELASGVPVDAELWYRGENMWRLHVWSPVQPWTGDTSAGFRFNEA